MHAIDAVSEWLLDSQEPWTRYRTWVDLLEQAENLPEVQVERAQVLAHPLVRALITKASA